MKNAVKFFAMLFVTTTLLMSSPVYAERDNHRGPRADGHNGHPQAHQRAESRQERAHKTHERMGEHRKDNHAKRQNRDPGVNHRQDHQGHRIAQGARSGELTKDEMQKLSAEQRSMRQEERQYKADGKLTKDERKDLHQDLNAASKHIYEEKHDAEKR